MKRTVFLIAIELFIMILPSTIKAAGFTWRSLGVSNGTFSASEMRSYDFWGNIYEDEKFVAYTEGPWIGYMTDSGLMMKQCSHELTPMPVQDNLWVLAYFGDVIGQDTIDAAVRLPLTWWYDDETTGGVLVENPSDFYLAFKVDEYEVPDGRSWYGWVRVSVGDDLKMSLLDYGINLDGGPVVVGVVTPEPSAALLVVLGLGLLGLRRRGRQAYDNV